MDYLYIGVLHQNVSMLGPIEEYHRVSCDFYDHIEILALRKTWVEIEYNKEGESVIEVTKLLSTKTKDKVEYAITMDHVEIRMDLIKSITPINPAVDMRVNLLEKLAYNYWANVKILSHLVALDSYPLAIGLKLSHIICAHDRWNRRILQMKQRFELWEALPMEKYSEYFLQADMDSKKILKQGALDRMIRYANNNGETLQSSVADILYHVINHGTYHRGQISDLLSSNGFPALPSDYIIFSQNKSNKL